MLYMGVTYRYMGNSYSLRVDKDAHFSFCVPYNKAQTAL